MNFYLRQVRGKKEQMFEMYGLKMQTLYQASELKVICSTQVSIGSTTL